MSEDQGVVVYDGDDGPIWERLPDETPAQYNAFKHYRDLPPGSRSVDLAYKICKGIPEDDEGRAGRRWFSWSSENDWVDRVAAYDLYVERQALEARKTDHLAEIDAYQQRLVALSKQTAESVAMMLQLANHSLGQMVEDMTKSIQGDDEAAARLATIPAKDLPTWMRALTDGMGKAMDAWATGLGVEALSLILEQQERAERSSEELDF